MTKLELEDYVLDIVSGIDTRGYITHRESGILEMKQSFSFGNAGAYSKTFAAFANAKGGVVIFGIKDSPRIPVGIKKDKFESIKIEKFTAFLNEHFSPQIHWNLGIVENDDKYFGYIYIHESKDKPVICKRESGKEVRPGGIYYRYRGQSKFIEYPELKKIHLEIQERERRLWMQHIQKISKIGPQNVAFIDLFQGEIESEKNKFIIDQNLLSQLKGDVGFYTEGEFSETEGAPVLKVIGEIEASDSIIAPKLNPDTDYPYFRGDLKNELGINNFQIQLLVWKYEIKGNPKYHLTTKSSKKSSVHKYSLYALKYLQGILIENETNFDAFMESIKSEYIKRKTDKET